MKLKKCISSMSLLALCFLFVGCGSLKLQSNTTIKNDGSGEFVVRQIAYGVYEDIVDKDKNTDFFGGKYKKAVKKVYNEGDKVIQEIKVPFKSIKELNENFKKATSSNIRIIVNKDRGLFTDKYSYEYYIPDIFTVKETMRTIEESGQAGLIEEQNISGDEVEEFISTSIVFENSLTVPGKILESNATTVNKNTAIWSAPLGQINPCEPLTLSYEAPSKLGICIIGGSVAIIALIGIITAVIIRKKKKNALAV